MIKRFSVLMILVLLSAYFSFGQSKKSEMSIEESYLQEAMELMIIRETSRSDSREQKLIAIEHIANALERGSTNDELRSTLEYLSLEGTINRVSHGKRLMNNYPEVRREAAKYLGMVGTKEAKTALIRICTSDSEPMVLQEAIKSLGDIGINDNDDTINAVVWVANKYNNSDAPDNILALVAVDTLDRLCEKLQKAEPNILEIFIKIMEGPYAPPVKERAKQAFLNVRKTAYKNQQEEDNS